MLTRVKKAIKILIGRDDNQKLDFNKVYFYPKDWPGTTQKFYGQYGEDLKIRPVFQNKKNGFFVEVGAMEGVRFSNTFLFEGIGWKGICIEPHPDYIDLLRKNRPGSVVLASAVGKEDKGSVDFYTNYRGSLSTLDKELEGYFRSHYREWFGGFKKILVPLVTLNTVLEKNNAPIGFDLLSIDTEGTEKDVLAGFDIEKWKPKVIIVETAIRAEPIEFMRKNGYILACTNLSNAIFCRDKADADIVRYSNIIGCQDLTRHPLD